MGEYLAVFNISEPGTKPTWGNCPDMSISRLHFQAEDEKTARELARQHRHFLECPTNSVSPATILEITGEDEGHRPTHRIVQIGESSNPDLNFPNLDGLHIE